MVFKTKIVQFLSVFWFLRSKWSFLDQHFGFQGKHFGFNVKIEAEKVNICQNIDYKGQHSGLEVNICQNNFFKKWIGQKIIALVIKWQ